VTIWKPPATARCDRAAAAVTGMLVVATLVENFDATIVESSINRHSDGDIR